LKEKDFEYIYVNLYEISEDQQNLLDDLDVNLKNIRAVPHAILVKDSEILYDGIAPLEFRKGDLSKFVENDSI